MISALCWETTKFTLGWCLDSSIVQYRTTQGCVGGGGNKTNMRGDDGLMENMKLLWVELTESYLGKGDALTVQFEASQNGMLLRQM